MNAIDIQASWRYRTVLWFLMWALWASADANAQFATVKGTIQTQDRVKITGATVRVIDPKSPDSAKDFDARDNGAYLIDDLRPGKYDFFACGLPYWPDENNGVNVKLKADETKIIKFVLQDPPPEDSPKMQVQWEGTGDPNTDGLVYLKDRATGCVIAQAPKNPRGLYTFFLRETPFEVCTRKRDDGKGGKEYTCHAPSSF